MYRVTVRLGSLTRLEPSATNVFEVMIVLLQPRHNINVKASHPTISQVQFEHRQPHYVHPAGKGYNEVQGRSIEILQIMKFSLEIFKVC